jgi:hypothetical protein
MKWLFMSHLPRLVLCALRPLTHPVYPLSCLSAYSLGHRSRLLTHAVCIFPNFAFGIFYPRAHSTAQARRPFRKRAARFACATALHKHCTSLPFEIYKCDAAWLGGVFVIRAGHECADWGIQWLAEGMRATTGTILSEDYGRNSVLLLVKTMGVIWRFFSP